MEFPIQFDKCPACGSERAIGRLMKEEMLAEGKCKEDFQIAIAKAVTPLVDPRTMIQRIGMRVLVSLFDICADCGCYYCVQIMQGLGQAVSPKQMSPKMGPNLPFVDMNRG